MRGRLLASTNLHRLRRARQRPLHLGMWMPSDVHRRSLAEHQAGSVPRQAIHALEIERESPLVRKDLIATGYSLAIQFTDATDRLHR